MSEIINIPQPLNRDLYLNDVSQASILSLTTSINSINKSDRNIEVMSSLSGFLYEPKPINLYIDSYGGDAYAMLGFLNIMDTSVTPIHTIVTGCAMSCGFLIAINGHKRYCHNYSTYMYHQVSSGTFGKLAGMKEDIREGERLMELIYSYVVNKTKLSEKKLRKLDEKHTDWYIASKEALKFSLVDIIL